jgi:glucosamine--fructose-6-phosphate aminotransferase (isomerizing)
VTTFAATPTSWLEQEIPRQGDVLIRAAQTFPGPVDRVVREAVSRGADDWVVTGCGDSLFAGLCAEVWFARRAGRRLRAVPAMELSRYLYEALTPRSVVLAVSHSGNTARVVEAARAARSRGACVVAVTANARSELVATADIWIDNSVHDERSNCRTASFQAVSALMRMLAERLADASGGGPAAPVVPAAAVQAFLQDARSQVDAIDGGLLTGDHWIFTGAGLGYPTAQYGMAKMYEAATVPAHGSELEQMIHCEIFTVRAGSTVVIVCPRGRALSRALELAEGLARLQATALAITDDDELAGRCTAAVRLPEMAEEELPFLAAVPLQWLALRVALRRGQDPDLVANKSVNRPLIDNSRQWRDEYLHDVTAGIGR